MRWLMMSYTAPDITLYIDMSGFMKTVWKNETRTLSGRFFLRSRRYKNYKQSQCFFPSSACLSPFRYPPFSTICPFLGPKEGLQVQWNQALGCSFLTPFSKIQTYIYVWIFENGVKELDPKPWFQWTFRPSLGPVSRQKVEKGRQWKEDKRVQKEKKDWLSF